MVIKLPRGTLLIPVGNLPDAREDKSKRKMQVVVARPDTTIVEVLLKLI